MADEGKRKTELRRKIEYQVACEKRAHQIVERLIDNPVTPDQLLSDLQFIMPEHYKDITEERAVSKLCGYPLCLSSLKNVLKQKYVISTKTNKVYDIETRKNFCSGRCYKASKHLEKQISTEPVWSRNNHSAHKFDLLPLDMIVGHVGDEVIVSTHVEIKEEIENLKHLDEYQQMLADQMQKLRKTSKQELRSDDGNLNFAMGDKSEMTESDIDVHTLDRALEEMKLHSTCEDSDNSAEIQKFTENKSKKLSQTAKMTDEKLAVVCENILVKGDVGEMKENKNVPLCRNSKQSKKSSKKETSSQSKSEYLMYLLDKQKSLLAKMADIQPAGQTQIPTQPVEIESKNPDSDKSIDISKCQTEAKTGITVCDFSDDTICQDDRVSLQCTMSKSQPDTSQSQPLFVADLSRQKGKHYQQATVLQTLHSCVQTWITKATIDYLQRCTDIENSQQTRGHRSKFEQQYESLVAKVDAHEKDFDYLLGEEPFDTEINKPSAPLPHFDFLKKEVEENQLRVQEFMKGSFVCKVKEKQISSESAVKSGLIVLPTVDKYDQMLIRQKIVLDRIGKVMPDLLAPLHLLYQDVITEIRELVFTFNLTSENILFKPAEWKIVTLMILKMLSKHLDSIKCAFSNPGAKKHFLILLKGVGCDIESFDKLVEELIMNKAKYNKEI